MYALVFIALGWALSLGIGCTAQDPLRLPPFLNNHDIGQAITLDPPRRSPVFPLHETPMSPHAWMGIVESFQTAHQIPPSKHGMDHSNAISFEIHSSQKFREFTQILFFGNPSQGELGTTLGPIPPIPNIPWEQSGNLPYVEGPTADKVEELLLRNQQTVLTLITVWGNVVEKRTGLPVTHFSLSIREDPHLQPQIYRSTGGFFRLQARQRSFTLLTEAPGFAPLLTRIDPKLLGSTFDKNGASPIKLFLEASGNIMGEVSAPPGIPLASVKIRLNHFETFTDSRGHFKLDRVPEGQHQLEIIFTDGSRRFSDPLSVRPGQTTGPIHILK